MIRNKKKWRRLERRAASGAVLGGLLLAAPGMAAAASTITDPVDAGAAVVLERGGSLTDGSSVWTNETITIRNGAYSVSGQAGTVPDPAKPEAWRKDSMIWGEKGLSMSGGTVELGAHGMMGASASDANGSTLLTISGGEVKLAGTAADAAGVLRAAYVGDQYAGFTLGDGASAAGDGGKLSVANGKYGVLSGKVLNVVKGGLIDVAGGGFLTLAGELPSGNGAAITANSEAGLSLKDADVTLNISDTLVYARDAAVTAGTLNITTTGNDYSDIAMLAAKDASSGTYTFGDADAANGAPVVNLTNGGSISGSAVEIKEGAYTVAGKSAFNAHPSGEAWRNGSMIWAEKGLTISGGAFTVGDYGILGASEGSDVAINGGAIALNGTSPDRTAMLRAAYMRNGDAAGLTLGNGAGEAEVSVAGGRHGVISAKEMIVGNNGALSVASGGTLDIVGVLPDGAGAAVTGSSAPGLHVASGLTVSGGSVSAAGDTTVTGASGVLKISAGAFNTGNLTLADGGSLSMSGGGLAVAGNFDNTTGSGDLSGADSVMVGGTYAVTGAAGAGYTMNDAAAGADLVVGALRVAANSAGNSTSDLALGTDKLTFAGLGEGTAFFNGNAITVNNGSLNLAGKGGAFAGAGQHVVLDGSTSAAIHVDGGAWSLGQVRASGGTSGSINVEAGHLTIGSLTSDDPGVNMLDAAVSGSGALTLNLADVASNTGGSWGNGSVTVDGSVIDAGATLELLASGAQLDKAAIAAIKTAVGFSGDGLLSFTGATITMDTITNDPALNGTVSEADAAGTGALLAGSTVGASGSGNADVTTGGYGADALVVKDGAAVGTPSATATVTLGGTLTLTGAGGTLVSVRDADGKATGAAVTVDLDGNTLNLGNGTVAPGSGYLNGITAATGVLNVVNGAYAVSELDLGNAGAASVNVAGNGALVLDSLRASGDTITVGDAGGAGTLIANDVSLGGSALIFDPPFTTAGDYAAASTGAVVFNAAANIDGTVTVGENSMATIGATDPSWLRDHIANLQKQGRILWGDDVTAALALRGPQELAAVTGGLKVDGSYGTGAGTVASATEVTFADKSLLVVDAPSLGGTPALTVPAATTVGVADGAKLYIADARTGDAYGIVAGATTSGVVIAGNGWSGDNLMASSYLQKLTLDTSHAGAGNGAVSVSVTGVPAASVLPGISSEMAGLLDSMYGQRLNNTNDANAGIRFASRATDRGYLPDTEAAKVLEGAAQIALAGGAPGVAFDAVDVTSGAVARRTGLAAPRPGGASAERSSDPEGYGAGVWAMPLYQHGKVSGMDAGNFGTGYESDLYGGIIGLDVTSMLGAGNLRLGVAFNAGMADVDSSGDFASASNDVDFWGATAYAGWRIDNFALTGDVGYTSLKNDIKQDLPGSLGMGSQLKGDVDAEVYTAGLKAEYRIPTAIMDITPSVGVRYRHYRQDAFSVDSDAGSVFDVDKTDMDSWTFPIGVSFSRNFMAGGWTVSPRLDLRYIPAAGDLDVKNSAKIPGMPITSADLTGDVVDRDTGEVGLGITLRKEQVSFGLNYDYQGSEHRDAHGVFATFRYDF